MKFDKPVMTAEDALAPYDLFRSQGITVWLDGGWGVDALLGRQTRPHSDLDKRPRCEMHPSEQIIEFHTAYKIDDDDAADVKVLCEKFGIEIPEEHKAYRRVRAGRSAH
jgi:hypothetical protein